MKEYSEVTINDVWPKLCELGIIELRINNRTVWSDGIMDVFYDRDDYDSLATDYLKRAEKDLLENYTEFRVTNINIKIDLGHHCIADITGYFENADEDDSDDPFWGFDDDDWDDGIYYDDTNDEELEIEESK